MYLSWHGLSTWISIALRLSPAGWNKKFQGGGQGQAGFCPGQSPLGPLKKKRRKLANLPRRLSSGTRVFSTAFDAVWATLNKRKFTTCVSGDFLRTKKLQDDTLAGTDRSMRAFNFNSSSHAKKWGQFAGFATLHCMLLSIDLEWPGKVKLKVTKILKPYISRKSLVRAYVTGSIKNQ